LAAVTTHTLHTGVTRIAGGGPIGAGTVEATSTRRTAGPALAALAAAAALATVAAASPRGAGAVTVPAAAAGAALAALPAISAVTADTAGTHRAVGGTVTGRTTIAAGPASPTGLPDPAGVTRTAVTAGDVGGSSCAAQCSGVPGRAGSGPRHAVSAGAALAAIPADTLGAGLTGTAGGGLVGAITVEAASTRGATGATLAA
jgi:hypothetical protein